MMPFWVFKTYRASTLVYGISWWMPLGLRWLFLNLTRIAHIYGHRVSGCFR